MPAKRTRVKVEKPTYAPSKKATKTKNVTVTEVTCDTECATEDLYFVGGKSNIDFIPSGCTGLDLVLGGGGWAEGRISNIVGDKSSGKCVRHAYISSENGMISIDDQGADKPDKQSELVQTLHVSGDQKVTATHFWKEEVAHTIRIKTRSGFELEATPDHKVMILRNGLQQEMVPFADLRLGDVAVLTTLTPNDSKDYFPIPAKTYKGSSRDHSSLPIIVPTFLTARLASILGLWVADGIASGGTLSFTSGRDWFKEELLAGFSEIQHEESLVAETRQEDRITSFRIRSKRAYYLFSELFGYPLKEVTARIKEVPFSVLQSPRIVQRSFLKSLMSCNSWVAEDKDCLEYYTASAVLAKQVQLLLMHNGIWCRRLSQRGPEGYEDHDYWTLCLGGYDFRKFMDIIGSFKTSRKISAIGDYRKNSIPGTKKRAIADLENWKKAIGWSRNGTMSKAPGQRIQVLSSLPGIEFNALTLNKFLAPFRQGKLVDLVDLTEYEELLNPDKIFCPITSLEELHNTVEVFDVHVPESHLFWCNGFISHNTLLAIEACANFAKTYPNPKKFKIVYAEAEAAFDQAYAKALGMPVDRIEFLQYPTNTVEELFEDLQKRTRAKGTKDREGDILTAKERGYDRMLYIIDSLDALSDKSERLRDIDQGTYGANKAKTMSQSFRRLASDLGACNIHLMVISQIRDKIGVTFGETKTRTGGRALDFYASQVLWIAEIGKLKVTHRGVERVSGVKVRGRCKKNKVGLGYREFDYPIEFGYGVDDLTANIQWLLSIKPFSPIEVLEKYNITTKNLKVSVKKIRNLPDDEYYQTIESLKKSVVTEWRAIDNEFMPKRKKY